MAEFYYILWQPQFYRLTVALFAEKGFVYLQGNHLCISSGGVFPAVSDALAQYVAQINAFKRDLYT